MQVPDGPQIWVSLQSALVSHVPAAPLQPAVSIKSAKP
jgi:hypothetical protein